MKHWIIGMAAWCCAVSLQAQDARTTVTLSVEQGTLHASYRLPSPVTRFALTAYDAPQRQDTWIPGDAWNFDGAVIRRKDGAAFSAFALALNPDQRFFDRHYVAVERVGSEGWIVFLNTLRGADGAIDVRFDLPQDHVVRLDGQTLKAPFTPAVVDGSAEQLVYLGPERNITTDAMTLVAGEEVPQWLRAILLTQTSSVVTALTERLGTPLARAPTLMVTYDAEWPGTGYKGSTLDGAVVSFSLRGMRLEQDDTGFIDTLINTAAHETVHLWNGEVWQSTRNAEEPWLHEGAAEYLASRLWQSDALLLAEAGALLSACVARGDRRPLDGSRGSVQGAVPYDCGFVMQLLAETAALRNDAGDIFDLWRTVFAAAEAGRYSPEDFLREASRRGGKAFEDAARLLLGDFADVDVPMLAAALTDAGLSVTTRMPDAREGNLLRASALRPILTAVCDGPNGFYSRPDHLKLDTGQRCGTSLANDPAITAVNGIDLFANPVQAHAAMRAACAEGQALVFGTPEGTELAPLLCNAAIQELQPVIELAELPAFPRP